MKPSSNYRKSFRAWLAGLSLAFILVWLALPVPSALAAPRAALAPDGAGTMSISPASAVYGSTGLAITFTFTADSGDLPAGSQVILSIAHGWQDPAGHMTVTNKTCALQTPAVADIVGSDVFIDMGCAQGQSFTVKYSGVKAALVSGSPYKFETKTDISGGGGPTKISAGSPWLAVTPKPLTVSATGLTPADKVYDGGTSITLTIGSPTLVGVVAGDTVTLVKGGALGTFNNKNVGTNKTVAISGLLLGGASAGNYTLVNPTRHANISAKPITVAAVSNTKVYDGTTGSTGVPAITPALAGTDTSGFIESFDTRNAGSGKTLTPTGQVLDGNGGANYAVTFVAKPLGVIKKKAITVSAVIDSRVYNGNAASNKHPSISPGLGIGDTSGFTQSFNNKNVGRNKTLTAAGTVNDGNSGHNYTISFAAPITTGTILPKMLTVIGISVANRVYDGTTAATLLGSPTLSGVISPDVVTLVTSGASATFSDKNVGNGKPVNITGLALAGSGTANYLLLQPSRSGNITKRPVTITAATDSKGYDGTVSSIGVPALTGGSLAPGDSAPLWTQSFATRNAGVSNSLLAAGAINDGNAGQNYAYTFIPNTTGFITKRPITVTAVTDTRAYDGTNASSGLPTLTAGSMAVGDSAPTWTQSFDSKHVGTGKTLTPSGLVNDGNGGNNYAYTFTPDTTGQITIRAITVTPLADTKPYDGTTASSVAPNINPALVGTDTSAFVQTFDTAAIGTGKTLTASGTVNDGNGGLNYAITFAAPITTGSITLMPITISADAKSKVIGSSDPPLTYHVTAGSLASGDSLTLSRTAGKTAGTYPITIASFPGQANYTLTFVGADLTITPIVTLTSAGAYDGWVLESTPTSSVGGSLNATTATFQLGDDALNRQYRGILSFDTSGLPDNAVIKSAVIKIMRSGAISGTNPFTVLGGLLVDVRKGAFGSAALALTDFQAAASAVRVGTFSPTPVGAWYSVTLTLPGRNNINPVGITQFRLYFAKGDNNNLKADFMKFASGNAGGGQPQLIITYTLP